MHSRKRNRMLNYGYAQDGIYFITVCTRNRYHHFGKIGGAAMLLSDLGMITGKQIL
jgi:hypothetical protein